MAELLTFQRFNDIVLATDFAERLNQLGIYCEIDNQTAPFDVTFANNPLEDDLRIKLRSADFARAYKALDDYYEGLLDTVEKDYYLYQFTNDELTDIIKKPDEWNRLDYQLAKKLLREEGVEISSSEETKIKEERVAELAKTDRMPLFWIILGYVTAILGGLFGLAIAIFLMYSKKTLPNGGRVYSYSKKQRSHGQVIMAASIASLIYWFILRFIW